MILLRRRLYLICALTDFSAFVVVFAVSRRLAEGGAAPWFLGLVGAGLSLSVGIASLAGGWLAQRWDGRKVFVAGAAILLLSIGGCSAIDVQSWSFLLTYWLVGIGLGFIYPILIGWLNQEENTANVEGVSSTLILFCLAWNLGMMAGQLTAGELFAWGPIWTYGVSGAAAALNLTIALLAVRHVVPRASAHPLSPSSSNNSLLRLGYRQLSWIANLGGMFGGSLVIHLLSDLAVHIGIPPSKHGTLLACWRLAIIATYLSMHRWKYWQYRFSISVVSQLLAVVGLVIIASTSTAATLLFGLLLLGQLVGYNYFSGLFYTTTGSTHHRRTLAASIHEATLAAGMALGTMVGGLFGSFVGLRAPYYLAAVVLLLLIMSQVAYWRLRVHPHETTRL